MTMTENAMDLIDRELARAATPRVSKKPLFLFLKEGHKAQVRPLYTLGQCVVLAKHNRYSDDASHRVNAICAREIKQECSFCELAKTEKKLSASTTFYLPIYVYGVMDTATGQMVTYKEKVDNQEVTQVVKGVRVLELSSFGKVADILKFFREFSHDRENCKLTECDFTISQVGQGQTKSFVTMPRAPKAMDPRLVAATPTQEALRARILEALPPVESVTAGYASSEQAYNMTGEIFDIKPAAHQDPAISSFLQAVKNGTVAPSSPAVVDALDDIGEF